MKISITYAELQDYVASHFHKTVNFGYVDETTVSVSVPIKVLGFTKSISINLIVKKIEHGLRFSMSDYREEGRLTNVPLYGARSFLKALKQ